MTQTIECPIPAEETRARRSRRANRLIDLRAGSEAITALESAAARKRDDSGVLATALTSAAAVLNDPADDEARDRMLDVATTAEFQSLIPAWVRELREAAAAQPSTGACTVATALKLWSWTAKRVPATALDDVAATLAPLLAARAFSLDATLPSATETQRDLATVYAARVSAQSGARCAELVFGYRKHLLWDGEGCATCYDADELDALEGMMPGIASGARTSLDVLEADGSHPAKKGPCVRFDGVENFLRLRDRLDGCLTGAQIARERLAAEMSVSEGGD